MLSLLQLRVHSVSQAVGRRPFTMETRFRAQTIPCGLHDGQNSSGRLFLRPDLLLFSPVSGVPTMFTTRMQLIACRCHMILENESAVPPPPLYLSLFYNSEHFFDIQSHPKADTQFRFRIWKFSIAYFIFKSCRPADVDVIWQCVGCIDIFLIIDSV